jgi:tight adherence protein B
MTPTTPPDTGWGAPFALLCGAGLGLGLMLIATFLLAAGQDDEAGELPRTYNSDNRGGGWLVLARRWQAARVERSLGRWALVAVTAFLGGAITRWPVAALLAAAGAWSLPTLLRRDPQLNTQVARLEAIATWTEMLRDTMAAAAGLEQAIAASAEVAPQPIRPEVQELQDRLRRGQRLPEALRGFADDVADPSCDLVVAALVMASQHQARQLGELLASLATATRDQVGMRLRVAATRSRIQTSVRVIVGTTIAMALGLALLNRSYLAPYGSLPGQVVLLMIGGVFAGGLAWLRKISAFVEPPRVLTRLDVLTVGGGHR